VSFGTYRSSGNPLLCPPGRQGAGWAGAWVWRNLGGSKHRDKKNHRSLGFPSPNSDRVHALFDVFFNLSNFTVKSLSS
jgi:hypothetical protein